MSRPDTQLAKRSQFFAVALGLAALGAVGIASDENEGGLGRALEKAAKGKGREVTPRQPHLARRMPNSSMIAWSLCVASPSVQSVARCARHRGRRASFTPWSSSAKRGVNRRTSLSSTMTRFIYALKEIRACLEAEILTDVQQRLAS